LKKTSKTVQTNRTTSVCATYSTTYFKFAAHRLAPCSVGNPLSYFATQSTIAHSENPGNA
jgi:hypothetical protein